jgi:hypothetical protein
MTSKAKTKLVRCQSCRGQGKTLGIGYSEKKCEPCKGIGYQEEVIDPIGYLEAQDEKLKEKEKVQDPKDPEELPLAAAKKEELADDAIIYPSKRVKEMKAAKREFVL